MKDDLKVQGKRNSVKKLLNDCMEEIKKKENANIVGKKIFNHQVPVNPSIIVNYNLAKKNAEEYYGFLKNIWPVVDQNLPKTDCAGDFDKIENEVRNNGSFVRFNQIHIHVLVDLVSCNVEDFLKWIKEKFSDPTYEIIVHEFMDYQEKDQIETLETHFIKLMKEQEKIQYRFVYSNLRANGGMWIKEDASRLWRLAANITALMSMSGKYFSDGTTYTFSYNLLEKPTWKILQFTVRRLLENMSSYKVDSVALKKDFTEKFRELLDKKAESIIKNKKFSQKSFEYLPSNKEINKEKKDANKSIKTLEKDYPLAASCVQAMIQKKIRKIPEAVSKQESDFSKEINEQLSYYKLNGFMTQNCDWKELVKDLENSLLSKREIDKFGTYSEILEEYANEELKRSVLEDLLERLEEQLAVKIKNAQNIDSWIQTWKDDPELQISAVQKVQNLEQCYGTKVDAYWNANQDNLIHQIDECRDKDNLLTILNEILKTLFIKDSIYYKSFEEEIDERVGKNTATVMFQAIDNKNNIKNNFCFNLKNLQFHIDMQITNGVVLLINPNSELLNLQITGNYEKLELDRLDCVERIDFGILKLKKQEDSE